jgi:hypothetical protein
MEFTNHYSARYGNKTTYRNVSDQDPFIHTNLHHPYAFMGIPGLPIGKGFENLRTNQGFFLSTGNVPYADLKIKLRFNNLIGMYSFDTE